MGWKKWVKKTIKKVTKPVSKVFKGVAKGIAKVGKSVMRGVSRISKKLGPLGMIAMSVAMPYALGGLSSMTTGMMNYGLGTAQAASPFSTFIRAVGNIGNTIRNGYRIGSGALGNATKFVGEKIGSIGNTITNTIRKTFTKFSNPSGKGNWFTRISEGAKNLFKSAKSVVTGQPTSGSVDVKGFGYSPHTDAVTTSMKSAQAEGLLKAGQIDGSMLSGQSVYGSKADKFITETINKASENTVKLLDKDALRHYNNVKDAMVSNGSYTNNQAVLDEVFNSAGTSKNYFTDFSTSPDSYSFDFSKSKDYKLVGPIEGAGTSGSYTFTGDETFNTPVGKVNKYKETIKKAKKGIYQYAKESLFKPNEPYEEFEPGVFVPTQSATSNDGYLPGLSSTNITGSSGSSEYEKVFGTAAWQKLKNYHKHMNYQGDQYV
jgi:hypothetical protein